MFQGLHGSFRDLSDALHLLLNDVSSKSIVQSIAGISEKQVFTLKLKLDALITHGTENIDPVLVVGGDMGRQRVESDDLVAGRKRKGRWGHASKILANILGITGRDSTGDPPSTLHF